MPHKSRLFILLNIGTTLKKTMHMTLNELVSLHLYLDELIVCVKGMMITSYFEVIGPFQIDFILDTNSYISKYLHEQLFPYNTNNPRLKYCEGST
jgi:hypothetical protein